MTINRLRFDKDNPTEGYEQESDPNADAVDVRGVYVQNNTSNDTTVLITRDASGNLTFIDPVLGVTKTLTQLAEVGLSYIEFLLDNEPIAETGATDAAYTNTFVANRISQEIWRRNDTTKIKQIDYTYTGNKLTTEIRKVYAADGTTIVAQVTWTYTYIVNSLTSASMIRNV